VVLEGGTLTSSAGPRCGLPVRRALRGAHGAESVRRVSVVGTLLGPEGAGDRCFMRGLPASRTTGRPAGRVGSAGSGGG
jgi:hypothetical protein